MLNEGDVSAPSASRNELFISDCFCLVFGDSSMDQTHIKHKKRETSTWVAVVSSKAVLADTEAVLAEPLLAAVVGTVHQRAVLPDVAGPALARPVDAGALVRAVVQAPPDQAVFPGERLLTHALPVDAQAPARAVGGAPRLRAVLPSKVAVTHALPFHARPLARAVIRAAGLRAVLTRPAFLADATAEVKVEAAVSAAAEDKVQTTWKRQTVCRIVLKITFLISLL